MQPLNLPAIHLKVKIKENKYFIFDEFRKKEILLTPEEWVRQHFAYYLIEEKKYPKSLLVVEKELKINQQKKRTDILIFNTNGQPDILVECKAPHIHITEKVFDQIARYNLEINANILIVTNGLQHFVCSLDYQNKKYIFLQEIPTYIAK